MSTKMLILIMGVKRKLARGENIEEILSSYVKLSEQEKEQIRDFALI